MAEKREESLRPRDQRRPDTKKPSIARQNHGVSSDKRPRRSGHGGQWPWGSVAPVLSGKTDFLLRTMGCSKGLSVVGNIF